MTYMTKDEIKATLDAQFSKLNTEFKNGNLTAADVETIVFSENDIVDSMNIEPNSSNLEYARNLQHEFINFNFR